jgi:hypothetical protein
VPYQWIRFLHIVSAIGFIAIHGTSMLVLHSIRSERSRPRIEAILDFSGRTANAMYISMVAVVGTGLWMGIEQSTLLREYWYWWALALLALTSVLMWFVAKPFTARLRAACEIRPSGIPRVSDSEIGEILNSSRPNVIAAIGIAGIGLILYLMVFQPAIIGDGSFGGGGEKTSDSVPGDVDLLVLGEELFQRTAGGVGCAACHGPDGQGTSIAPNITGVTKSRIVRALNGGVPQMSSIELTDTEIDAVYAYLETLP